ncbi:MAG: PIN domain-containing protein [Halobacteriaceae archaeon]
MRVAMDTSALMLPVQADVRVFDELDRLLGAYEAVVPEAVLTELESLAGRGGEPGRAARVGADLAERLETVQTAATEADDALVELVERDVVDAVVTNDAPLRERVLARGAQAIHLRGDNQLTRTHP